MADLTLALPRPRTIRLQAPFRLTARLRLMRRNLRRDRLTFNRDDRLLVDIGLPRRPAYDWLAALMRR